MAHANIERRRYRSAGPGGEEDWRGGGLEGRKIVSGKRLGDGEGVRGKREGKN